MPGGPDYYPSRDDFIAYLTEYERRYQLAIERPVVVERVERGEDELIVITDRGALRARMVVSATGTWNAPRIPHYPGQERFRGTLLHAKDYDSPLEFVGQRVLVVGGGNTGAQVVAELSQVADTTWVTRRPPTFLPPDIDGRYLFDRATARYAALQRGEDPEAAAEPSLGDIVQIAPVREALQRGALESVRPFTAFTEQGVIWPDGREETIDVVIWCTGYRAVLGHLDPLGIVADTGRVAVCGTRSVASPRLWLVGYGEWTGYASATIVGVGRTARATVAEIATELAGSVRTG